MPKSTLVSLLLTALLATAISAAAPTAINYQGRLLTNTGDPVADAGYSVVFTIYDAAAVGNSKWTETQNVNTSDGLFSILLGSVNPILDTVFNGATRYLGIKVAGDSEISPRTALVTVPYSFRTSTVDGASGGNITSKLSIGGGHTNTGSDAFVAGNANIASGDMSTVGGGTGHNASGMFSTIAGGRSSTASATTGTVGGGIGNTAAGALASTVAGGESNSASASRATVGGGTTNEASGERSTISGGSQNTATGQASTIGGGRYNYARGDYSVVAGGGDVDQADSNYAAGVSATVSGGEANGATENRSTVSGGHDNLASANSATIGGGGNNNAEDQYGTIGGGIGNTTSGFVSTIAGGQNNISSGAETAVGGGKNNVASGSRASIQGGSGNDATGDYSSISGGFSNLADAEGAVVGGGKYNKAHGFYSVVAGGGGSAAIDSNSASGEFAVIGGGKRNVAIGEGSTVSGGEQNVAEGDKSAISGGQFNTASGWLSFIGGGQSHIADGQQSWIGGGALNTTAGFRGMVAGGYSNAASGDYGFAAGFDNTAAGDYSISLGNNCSSFGANSMAVGELSATSVGANHSVALGRRAFASEPGQFVFADATDATFSGINSNEFLVRASGGVGLGTNNPNGKALAIDNEFTGAGNVMLDLNASVDITSSGRDVLQIEVGGSATTIQYIECERGSDIEFRVHGDGDVTADGTFTGGGADFAELVHVSTGYHSVSAGDVMVIDPNNPRSLIRSSQPRSTLVAGIFSTAPGYMASEHDWDAIELAKAGASGLDTDAEVEYTPILELAAEMDEVPLAVVGIVPCKVSTENGPIRIGDLLVTSSTPGHSMRDDQPAIGTVVGKALESLSSGKGVIKVLITLN